MASFAYQRCAPDPTSAEENNYPRKVWGDVPQEKLDRGEEIADAGRNKPIAFQLLSDDDLDALEWVMRIRYLRVPSSPERKVMEYFWKVFSDERKRRAQKYKKKVMQTVTLFLLLFLSFLLGLFLRNFL